MKPFARAYYPEEKLSMEHHLARGLTPDQARDVINDLRLDTVFRNDVYQVALRDAAVYEPEWPPMIEMSVKRIDREPIHDWRDLQRIKNELIGAEHEAVELYPAESRLMDTANQYYIFVLKEAGRRFPFGFTLRRVATPAEAARMGAKQRPFR